MEKTNEEESRSQDWWSGWWESEYFVGGGVHEILIIRNEHGEALIGKEKMGEMT